MKNYEKLIVEALRGEGLSERERNYYGDFSKFLAMYDKTGGKERNEFISAIGNVLEKPKVPQYVKAGLVHFITSENLSQLEDKVVKLSETREAKKEPLKRILDNYFAFRKIYTNYTTSFILHDGC